MSIILVIILTNADAQNTKYTCKICCDKNDKNVISTPSYNGFIINSSTKDILDLYPDRFASKELTAWLPDTQLVNSFENKLEAFHEDTMEKNCFIQNKCRAKYLRQYVGLTINEKKYLLVTFTWLDFLENFCEDYYDSFSNRLTKVQFQRKGLNYLVLYDLQTEHLDVFDN